MDKWLSILAVAVNVGALTRVDFSRMGMLDYALLASLLLLIGAALYRKFAR